MATGEAKNQNHERALGMDQRISRRDYCASSPLRLLGEEDWDGYSGVGDHQGSNGNRRQAISDGHKVRDHAYDKMPSGVVDTREVYDCVVVGGGMSPQPGFFFGTNGSAGPGEILRNRPHARIAFANSDLTGIMDHRTS